MQETLTTNNNFQRAKKLCEINRFREAIPLLTKTISEKPRDYKALCYLSICFSELKEPEKALLYAEKAIAAAPENEWAYRLKGEILRHQGKRKAALDAAEKAFHLAPESADTLANLIYSLLSDNKLYEAREAAAELLRKAPDSAESHYLIGLIEKAFDNYPEAERWFRQALGLSPNNAEIRNLLAFVILKQANRATAQDSENLERQGLGHLTESVRVDPNNQFVIEDIKDQFDNSIYYFAFVYLFPLFLFGLKVTPVVAVLIGLIKVALLVSMIRDNNRRVKKLSPEMQQLFKIRNHAVYLREKTTEFFVAGSKFLKVIWLQYLIALSIFLCYFFSSLLPFHENFYFDIKMVFWGNLYWMFRRFIKYAEPPKSAEIQGWSK
jgi:Tfp pilus assembly protein PilF